MKKKFPILLIFLLTICTLLVSCKKSSDDQDPPPDPAADTPIFKEGDIVASNFYIADVLREQMIDTVVNLGRNDKPALFYINQAHTLDGETIATGNHYSNIFRSLTRQEIYEFIVLWGIVHGQTIDPGDTTASAIEMRQDAFYDLFLFLLQHDVDFPLLVSMAKNQKELTSAIQWINAAAELSLSGMKLAGQNTPDHIFRAIEFSDFDISDLSSAVRSYGMTERDFLMNAQNNGVDLERALMHIDSPRQINIVCLVALGIKMFTSWVNRFINHGTPNPNLENEYASYLSNEDSVVMNYYTGKTMVSNTYKIEYASFVKAEFIIETYYDAYHLTISGHFVNRIGMIVQSIKCSWGMHLDGWTTFYTPTFNGTENDPVIRSWGNVIIQYGDCCAFKRAACLVFDVYGDTGYQQRAWDPGS